MEDRMADRSRIALSVPIYSLACLGIVYACGVTEPEPDQAQQPDGSVTGTNPGADGSTTTPGADGSTTGPVADGGTGPTGNPPQGQPSDPKKVTCGSTTCDTATQTCCVSRFQDAGCRPANQFCAGREFACDEAADCDTGELCCLDVTIFQTFDAGGFFDAGFPTFDAGARDPIQGSRCRNRCRQQPQSCRTDAECDGGTCVAQQCGGRVIQTCGALPAGACP
jgi:hypothetical protein